jgi:Asp-tRNA(Asn)/Glu-tRNA(Gln) amidotransferase A subunit family amidase
VQLIGRPGSENLLLAVAEDLERRGVVGTVPPRVPA